MFFFILKNVPNICNYSVFDCIIFFFNQKIFLISLIVVSSSSFSKSSIMLSYNFLSFLNLELSIIKYCKEINCFLLKKKFESLSN